MKKPLFLFIIFSLMFGPALAVLAQDATIAEPAAPSVSTETAPLAEPVVLEAPTTADPLTALDSAQQEVTNTQISEPLDPQSSTIIDPGASVGDNIVADPINPVIQEADLNQEAVNQNEPGRDPGEGENQGAYQQEKSADNSFKKQAGLTGQLRVDQFSGAASYNIGLEVPAGRSGLNPSLLLAYNSHDKSNDSWVGQGWSLPLGSISRTTKRGTNNLYTSNEFTLFLGGQSREIIETDAENHLFSPKEESDFLKIQYAPDSSSWLVTDTQGIKYYFGQTAASRQDDPSNQDKIYSWKLDKVLDTNNNFYKLEYVKINNQNQIYPSRIVYTGHADQDGPMEILFNLQERGDDTITSYQTQFLVTTDQRLRDIEIKVSGQTISRYQLAYTTGQNGRTSLLQSITKKGYKDGQEPTLPATTFTYSTKQSGWSDDVADNWRDLPALSKHLVDVNGDSWVDVGLAFHNGRGFGGAQDWHFPTYNVDNGEVEIGLGSFLADVNGDKMVDIIINIPPQYNRLPRRVYLSNGINGFSLSPSWSAALPEFMGDREVTATTAFVDLNGDGLDDMIHAYWGNGRGGGSGVKWMSLNTGSGWGGDYGNFPVYLAYCDLNFIPMPCESTGVQMVDINGDGLPDVFHSGQVYLNTGSGFEQEPNQQWSIENFNLPQGMQNPWQTGGARTTDLNGDGLIDLTIAVTELLDRQGRQEWIEYFASWLNTGSGWQQNNNWNLPELLMTNAGTDQGVRLLDINNDNAIDLAQSYVNRNNNNDFVRQVYLGSAAQGNQLTTITNGYGGQTNLEYQPSGQYFTEDNHFKNPHLPLNLETVKTIITADGQGNEIVTDYDYQDGAVYSDPVDVTLNQFAGFGIVTSTTGDQVTKTYYHQGSGIDGYENGEYEDTIYKKGRPYREEVYQDNQGDLVLQSAKVSTYKQGNLDHNRKYVYLDGTVAYDYTQAGEQQQMLAPGNFNQAQAVNQQAIQQSLAAQTLSSNQLTELQAAQTFNPTTQPQLVYQSADGSSKTYYLGRDENGQHVYRYEVYNSGAQQEPGRDDNERGNEQYNNFDQGNPNADGHVIYNGVHGRQVEAWDVMRNAQSGNEVNYRDNTASLWNDYGHISRVFLPFNTTPLPNDITITGASLTLYLRPGNARPGAIIVQSNQHINQLQAEDYSTVGNVAGGSFWQAEEGRYTTNLNADGRSWINPDGWTKLALRGDADFDNQRPQNDGRNHSTDVTMSEVNSNNPLPLLTVNFYYNNITPGVPTDLQLENQVNPVEVQNQQPHFSAIFNDENQDDAAIAYSLQVIRDGGSFANQNDLLCGADEQPIAFDEPVVNGQRTPDMACGDHNFALDGMKYFWRVKFWDNGDEVHSRGLWSDGQDYFYMDGSLAPQAPINLLTESRIEPRDLLNQNPSFSAIYRDPNPIDLAKWYEIEVFSDENLQNRVWYSDKQELNQLVDNGVRSEEIQYAGQALEYNGTLYYWQIKFWDDEDDEEENGTEGEWSAPATFSMFNSADTLNNVQAKAAKFHYDFSTGNILQEENLGAVLAAQNGVFLNIAEEVIGDEKNSTYQYAQPVQESLHILSAPKSKVITDPITQASSTVAITYDGLNFGQVQKANPTKEDLNLPQTIYEKTFNSYGLVTQTKDPLNHRTTVTYDNNNYYPATTRNHLNQTTQTAYDLATGQIKRIVDPNGVIEERDYDAFGRLVEVRKTNPASVNLLVMQRYEYHDSDNPSWVRQINYPGQSFELSSYSYFDGLGRTIQTRVQTSVANQYQVSSVEYDQKGNTKRTSLVILANGSAYQQPDWNNSRTEYTYDAQNRVLTEEFIGDADHRYLTSYAYDGWNVTVTDANGNLKKLYKDAYGQLIQVDEYLDNEVYSVKYEYNLLGKLIKITDSQNNVRNFNYDALGRLISQEEMHTANAEEFGVWSYQYDSASNLISKTDPKGQVTNYTYDSLNRILTENYAGAEGIEVSYTYDTGTYGKGRLYRVVSAGATAIYTYDKWGRVKQENKTIDNRLYISKWDYNLQSVPTTVTYPDNSKVYYSYNKEGLPIRLRTADPDQNLVTSMPLIDNVVYSPLKQISRIDYTNGTITENTFDPIQAYRLTHKSTVNTFDTVLQDLTYAYDNVGNITQLVDQSETLLAKTTNYEYDDLYRLTGAVVTGSANNADYQQTFSYDVIGNILNKSDLGEYLYQNANPYQTNSVNNVAYAYDVNGNLTNDEAKTYHYNYADRLISVDIDQDNVLYNKYDQSGQRTVKELRKTVPNTQGGADTHIAKNLYPNSVYEEEINGLTGNEANWQTKKTRHITLGNQTLAHFDVNPQGITEKTLVFSDHLGSSSILTDSMGRVKTLYDYYPFGGTRFESTDGLHVAAQRYTGKELDEEINLHYYGQRYYNQNIGQFTQADPVALVITSPDKLKEMTGQDQKGFLTNPQVLNSYAYTANNPIIYVDPDGNKRELPYITAYNKLVKLIANAIDNYVAHVNSERQNKVNEYAAQYDGLSDSQKSHYKDGQQYGEARVTADDASAVVIGMMGGAKIAPDVAKKIGEKFYAKNQGLINAKLFENWNKIASKLGMKKAIIKAQDSINSFLVSIGRHLKELEIIKSTGGYTSSVQSEINAASDSIKTLEKFIKDNTLN